jgi:hypothetical protein
MQAKRVGLQLVIDSGCTWHIHGHAEDLVNLRPCLDSIGGIDDVAHPCTLIGDLPLYARSKGGRLYRLVLKDVRVAKGLPYSLISVKQLWATSRVDCVFRDSECMVVPMASGDVLFPFKHRGGIYQWRVDGCAAEAKLQPSSGIALRAAADFPPSVATRLKVPTADGQATTGAIHRSKASAHLNALGGNTVAAVMHRRLHAGLDRLKRLAHTTADAPAGISTATELNRGPFVEANATRVPHSGSGYSPTYPGRLVHADILGPFTPSRDAGYRFVLVLVDDDSRLKAAYPLKRKSDAPLRVREFVASFNALLNKHSTRPRSCVGALHTDNAGEFLSRDFTEFLCQESIAQTTCPPHVHQLNGVAERAIRSIMEVVRASLLSGNVPVSFWPEALEHAVDILNRTTGPPDDSVSSYERVTGEKPKVMGILPLGCRVYALKPESQTQKTVPEARAWAGVNLGRSSRSPGAYKVWLPNQGKLVITSEVFFDEMQMPWRAKGDQRCDIGALTAPPEQQPAVLPEPLAPSALVSTHAATPPPAFAVTLADAYDAASRGTPAVAKRSRRVLILFSGPYARPDGLAAFLTQLGLESIMVDNDAISAGGARDDLSDADVYSKLVRRAAAGEFRCILAAPPCSTFSVSRHFAAKGAADGGPPVVRTRLHPSGLPEADIPPRHRAELQRANLLVERTVGIVRAGAAVGADFIVEHPADRSIESEPAVFLCAEHGSLWRYPSIIDLAKDYGGASCTFAQCMLGGDSQKYTTLLYSPGLTPSLAPIDRLRCLHRDHRLPAGGAKGTDGAWDSWASSAYPADMNLLLARSVAGLSQPDAAPDVTAPATEAAASPAFPPGLGYSAERAPAAAPAAAATAPAASPARDRSPALPSPPATASTVCAPGTAEPPPPPTAHLPAAAAPTAHDATARKLRMPRPVFQRLAGRHQTRSTQPADLSALDMRNGHAGEVLSVDPGENQAVLITRGRGLRAALPHGAALLAQPSADDPRTQRQAYAEDKAGWLASELVEIKNHEDNASWTVEQMSSKPRDRKLVKLIWVYKRKRDGRMKSRLCVQGCAQIPGVDYEQTFCSTMRPSSLRLLSAISARFDLYMHRWDFVAAYLQGELLPGEVVWCYPPPGHEHNYPPGTVMKVIKPIYGMAQAGRRWQRTIFPWFLEHGFTQTKSDDSVFTLQRTVDTPSGPRHETLVVGVYVDDLFCLYSHADEHSLYAEFTAALQRRWSVDDEGPVSDLLGIEIKREGCLVSLRQTGYIDKLCARFCPDGCPASHQATKTPCDIDLVQHVADALASRVAGREPPEDEVRRYQSLVGALLYAAVNTRPDVAYAVGMLCRAMCCPTPELYEDALRVLHYLHRHRDIGLTYEADQSPLAGHSDSDWAVKHSTSGWLFTYSRAVVTWGSKKQQSIALSSCEAEVMALSEACKDGVYLATFLDELQLKVEGDAPPVVYGDNRGANDLAYNSEHHQRTKHIDRRYFWVRELVEDMRLSVAYVNTVDNLADFLTKPLPSKTFFPMRDRIMNVPHTARLGVSFRCSSRSRGGVAV